MIINRIIALMYTHGIIDTTTSLNENELIIKFKLLSKYNQLMNQRIYEATAKLPDEKVTENKGAFFKSLLGTLNHIMVGDIIWLSRFATNPSTQTSLSYFKDIEKPQELNSIIFTEFNELRQEREKVDKLIINWIDSLTEKNLNATIAYKNMKGKTFKKEYSSLINHFFLHQVHHRGQVTTLLSQSDIDFGDTDLVEMIKEI